ncbi:heat repeat [Trichoderma arundinaceum]|uniref:Heat repeat n=1 Tax=Trichoderma arundinaceum TaxID=490622 RepID=A0A395NDQ1_TRIAR|nr:heat repeat [Trichoderma arundinaceum]
METTPAAKERNELFQKLKPCCVKVSQLAIRESEDPKTHRELLELVSQILSILNEQISKSPLVLDEKLAEYVFFPLYHIFRQLERYPMNLVEDCVKCLSILIVHGWKSKISAKLVQQIFSFLIFIIDGVPGSPRRDIPEETVLEAFRAETALLTTAGTSIVAAAGLSAPESIPALGHGITVMLEGVAEGATAEIQREALRTLEAVYGAIKEHAALASFLPGTISSFAKVLSKPSRYKKLVIAKCLGTVRVVLTRVLADMRTRSILAKDTESQSEDDKSKVLSPAWLKATVAQVQVALSVMMKLRTHEASEVREALGQLCVTLLDECHTTLSNCTAVLVETSVILDQGPDQDSMTEINLRYLVNIYPELGETIKSTVFGWMSSLPRLVQASDEKVKEQAVYNLSKGIELLRSLRIESSTLDDSITSTLRESIMSIVTTSKTPQSNTNSRVLLLDDGASASASPSSSLPQFQSIILGHEGQRRLKSEIMGLLRTVGSMSQHTRIAANMLDCVRESVALNQLTAYWLCFELVKAAHASSEYTDALFDLSEFTDQSDDINEVFDELYDFSVQVLDSHTEMGKTDWRLEAIALEIMAYAAHRSGEKFRPELIDVLFPVATFLGSENGNLQQHAIATLNSIALSCQYSTVSELIIDNVDYMVNSVSLRLNTLDISPASTQVLRMMVRLAGPRLVPFLDDVVESMFAALENYHGYASFVESLFAVLKEIVDQAAQADGRLLTDVERSSTNHKKEVQKLENLETLLELLDRRKEREERDKAEMENMRGGGGHPGVPWTRELAQGNNEDDQGQEEPPREEEKPPNSPTYQLLQRVATLTQHYLTSPTPTLRRSLLELLTTASSVLAADEDSFLPLVNAIWPVVIARLHDPETFIVIEACETLAGLCKAAGDFLSTRWKTEWWDGLGDWCRKIKQQASRDKGRSNVSAKSLTTSTPGKEIVIPIRSSDSLEVKPLSVKSVEQSPSGGLGQHASPVRIWEAVVKLLTAIISYVRVEDDMFDEILELLADAMERDQEVRDALEVINADAVWALRYERGLVEWAPAPTLEGVVFPEMDRIV